MAVEEQVFRLGGQTSLTGILSRPVTPAAAPTAAILLSAGVLHRVGPNRLYVDVARDLAGLGIPTLRLDFSGIGDSSSRSDGAPFLASSLEETCAAMDAVEQRLGCHRFLLAGLCSGGNAAYAAAATDDRVVGAALVNVRGHLHAESEESDAYYRDRALRRHYLRLATRGSFRWKNWRKALSGNIDVRGLWTAIGSLGRGGASGHRGEVGAELDGLAERGVRVAHIYCEGDEGLDYARVVLGGTLARLRSPPSFETTLIPGANHTFTLRWSQLELRRILRRWAVPEPPAVGLQSAEGAGS